LSLGTHQRDLSPASQSVGQEASSTLPINMPKAQAPIRSGAADDTNVSLDSENSSFSSANSNKNEEMECQRTSPQRQQLTPQQQQEQQHKDARVLQKQLQRIELKRKRFEAEIQQREEDRSKRWLEVEKCCSTSRLQEIDKGVHERMQKELLKTLSQIMQAEAEMTTPHQDTHIEERKKKEKDLEELKERHRSLLILIRRKEKFKIREQRCT